MKIYDTKEAKRPARLFRWAIKKSGDLQLRGADLHST